MKLLCKENHWKVYEGKLILDTPTKAQEEISMRMVAAIEARVRLKIYDEICALRFTDNRKTIVKAGIDNALLTVQALCADVALGDKK